jgi:hypothetical protein
MVTVVPMGMDAVVCDGMVHVTFENVDVANVRLVMSMVPVTPDIVIVYPEKTFTPHTPAGRGTMIDVTATGLAGITS